MKSTSFNTITGLPALRPSFDARKKAGAETLIKPLMSREPRLIKVCEKKIKRRLLALR
jgi:hypothetical protein